MQTLKQPHRAWLILIVMMLIQAGTMGAMFNCSGILFSAIIEDLGFGAGDLSLYYLIRSLFSSVFVGITTRWFFCYDSRKVMALLGCAYVGSVGMMAFFTELWQWYLSGILCGLGMSCTMVVIPVVLNNWFRVNNGLVIGITMSASGVAGAVLSPVYSRLVEMVGWRTTALIMCGIGFCCIVLPSLFLVSSPAQVGLQPYGMDRSESQVEKYSIQTTPMREPASMVFGVTLVALLSSNCLIQFNVQLPTFAQSIGYSIHVGATFTSLAMLGNLLGKLVIGMLVDKIGVYNAVRIFLSGIAVSMVLYLFCQMFLPALYLASAIYGAVYAIGTTVPSLLYLDLYGLEKSREKMSRMSAVSGISSAVLSAAFPYAYDLTGSFDVVFMFGIGVCILAFFLFTWLNRCSRSIHRSPV